MSIFKKQVKIKLKKVPGRMNVSKQAAFREKVTLVNVMCGILMGVKEFVR